MKRTVIIHCHIFKNAGHTFDWSLKNNFGESFLDHRDSEKMKRGAGYLGGFISESRNLKALSSHHIRFPLPDVPDVRLLPAIILRHPIDRLGSIYLYERKHEGQYTHDADSKKISLQEFMLQRISSERPGVISNFQTRFCLDRDPHAVNEKEFKLALERVGKMPLLGLVDYYDESMVLFEETLRPYYPDIDLSYAGQNISLSGEKNLEQRIRAIFDVLGIETLDTLLAGNHWDLMLYLETKSILRKRIREMPDFTGKLNDFYRRCLSLRNIEIREH
ncbi:MAG: hypothetical protein C4526_12310 [Nitrospiraceae bacterium]|nr:MAG: hypothetical protein C4526_12310 [Nitrospiraceae bacterium]